MNSQGQFRDDIDDYVETIHAMIGFIIFYLYDKKSTKDKDDVLIFQGRRLRTSQTKTININNTLSFVTPDIGILLPSKNGVIGEVKMSFPQNQDYWMDTFEQLIKYDDDLT